MGRAAVSYPLIDVRPPGEIVLTMAPGQPSIVKPADADYLLNLSIRFAEVAREVLAERRSR